MAQDVTAAFTVEISGAVQGVGFRPFVYRLSQELQIKGFVRNSLLGLSIHAQGKENNLKLFVSRLKSEAPLHALIQKFEYSPAQLKDYPEFVILESEHGLFPKTIALPDLATCQKCCEEISDSGNRRYAYPFTNCTDCGPRYSILESLPYDRSSTSMKSFKMCAECQAEFEDPDNRRFHAQPNACSVCGPSLELWDSDGHILKKNEGALKEAVQILRGGKILALKGLGGFQLLAQVGNATTVKELRKRKHREEKPFAVLFPSMEMVRRFCAVSQLEENLLSSAQAPIVLLEKLSTIKDFEAVAPDNPYLGVMLAYTPLHHLLIKDFDAPLVATSGNLSDEPICTDEHEALKRLGKIADFFLVHNRPIVRALDDSVVRVIKGKPFILRRARGYAPWPVEINESESCVLGLGGHYKNTVALKVKSNVFLSAHIGDLQNAQASEVFKVAVEDFKGLYAPVDLRYACDLHPDYFSTRFAKESTKEVFYIQHHHAHIAAVMAEHNLSGEVFGIAWDGTGLGADKTIWGGEFLLCTRSQYKRFGHLRNFRLPGADLVSRLPYKSALGLLYELSLGNWEKYRDLPCFEKLSAKEIKVLEQMLKRGTNSPLTSSMGRLFDAVSSLTGICQQASFEGQAAMKLEFARTGFSGDESYSSNIFEEKCLIVDWAPMIREIIDDVRCNLPVGAISLKFHNTLIDFAVKMAQRAGRKNVVVSGGCFQNKYLLEHLIDKLEKENFNVFWPQSVPVNDGGLSLGQICVACARMAFGEN